ncbi:hypothetical protein E2320_000726, partial [Naja naja]
MSGLGKTETKGGENGMRKTSAHLEPNTPACILSSYYLVLIRAAPNITENATIDINVEPEFPVVGVTVILRPKNTSEKIVSCAWGRGEDATYKDILIYELSPALQLHKKAGYNTRHTPGKDCSLSIKNISKGRGSSCHWRPKAEGETIMEGPLSSWGCLVLVLIARILTSSLVFAQMGSDITIMIHMEPKLPKVGGDVTLFPEENKNDTISCAWYKRENETLAYSEILIYYVQNRTIYFSSAYDKRHFLGKDCLLHLQNLRLDDRAIFEIRKKRTGVMEKGEKLSAKNIMAMLPKHKKPSEWKTSQLVWLLTAQAAKPPDFTIEVVPRYPLERQDVRLIPQKPTNDTESCLWFRGENETYLQIVLYYPSNNTFDSRPGFHSGHMPLEDCILGINNVSYLDMALYGMIMKLPAKSLFGETFLMVTR